MSLSSTFTELSVSCPLPSVQSSAHPPSPVHYPDEFCSRPSSQCQPAVTLIGPAGSPYPNATPPLKCDLHLWPDRWDKNRSPLSRLKSGIKSRLCYSWCGLLLEFEKVKTLRWMRFIKNCVSLIWNYIQWRDKRELILGFNLFSCSPLRSRGLLEIGFQQPAQLGCDPSGEEGELIAGLLRWDSAFVDNVVLGDTMLWSLLFSLYKSSWWCLGQNIWLIRGQNSSSWFLNEGMWHIERISQRQ